MSETEAKYETDNWTVEQHIEQECIKGSFDRLYPILADAHERAENAINDNNISLTVRTANIERYVELEKVALELARFALDYFTESRAGSSEGLPIPTMTSVRAKR